MIIDIILLWMINLFGASKPSSIYITEKESIKAEHEDLKAFFFGTYPLEREDNSHPVNEDYDKGPDW